MSLSPHTPAIDDQDAHAKISEAAARLGATTVGATPRADGVQVQVALGEHLVELTTTRSPLRATRWRLSALRSGAAAELSVRPELAGEGIDKLLGMTLDLDTGDAPFDARFVIEAAPAEVMRHLLHADLRAAMLALPRSDEGPTLKVDASGASLAWDDRCGIEALTAALRAMFDTLERCRALHETLASRDAPRAPFRASAGGHAAVDPEARSAARSRIQRARARAAAVVATAAMAGAAFLASVLTVGR